MVTKTVAWNSGSGVITLTYTGQGNGSVSVKSDANDSFDERSQNLNIVTTAGSPEKAVQALVKQAGKPLGWTTKDFDYTGSVQEVTLPKGRYKLQCWGAQGGSVTGTYAATGSKGGYSEGIITLTETTTLYIFVGGQGASYTSAASQTSTTVLNGGWNGGGAGVRTSRYSSDGVDGRSFPRGGGGATDIAIVTSSMSYLSGRTNRSSQSLLSRIIVAGGGAGASASHTIKTTTEKELVSAKLLPVTVWWTDGSGRRCAQIHITDLSIFDSSYRYALHSSVSDNVSLVTFNVQEKLGGALLTGLNITLDEPFTLPNIPSNATFARFDIRYTSVSDESSVTAELLKEVVTTAEQESSSKSTTYQHGGGVRGLGVYPGKESSAGNGAEFGNGANQITTNYRYCGGAGGGGWYGGGTNHGDNDANYVQYSGGGSGFINTAANASYRPSGYTGLQLDSGSTTAGNSSHPSVSGGTEVGHSGNGYARITVIN